MFYRKPCDYVVNFTPFISHATLTDRKTSTSRYLNMKHFFDNVRDNNKTMESEKDERDALLADITYLRGQCGDGDGMQETAGSGLFAMEKTRLYKILHSL